MRTETTKLSFEVKNQSQQGGEAVASTRWSTGDLLVFGPSDPLTKDFDADIWVAGVEGKFTLDFKVGLQPYIQLPGPGFFEAGLNLKADVTLGNADLSKNDRFVFDVTELEILSATVDSTGFRTTISAGIDMIIGAKADFNEVKGYIGKSFLKKEFGPSDWTILNFQDDPDLHPDELDPQTINLFKVGAGDIEATKAGAGAASGGAGKGGDKSPGSGVDKFLAGGEISFELTDGLKLVARMPSGADIKAISTQSLTVTAEGHSDNFIELAADIDALLLNLAGKFGGPSVKANAELLKNTVFAEHEFDAHDIISKIPEGKIKAKVVGLDVNGTVGANITEELTVDFTGKDGTEKLPDVTVTLYELDENGKRSGWSSAPQAVADLLKNDVALDLPTPKKGTGEVKFEAEYKISGVEFSHTMGLGLNAILGIAALQGQLEGGWVPDALKVSFGPLLDVKLPKDGFQLDLLDFFTRDRDIADGRFDPLKQTYTYFYTDKLPEGADIDAPDIAQTVDRHLIALASEALQAPAGSDVSVDFLWADNKTGGASLQALEKVLSGDTRSETLGRTVKDATATTYFWQSDTDATFDKAPEDWATKKGGQPNHLVVQSTESGFGTGGLSARLTDDHWTSYFTATGSIRSTGIVDLLDALGKVHETGVSLKYFAYQDGGMKELTTQHGVSVVGGNMSDLLVYYPGRTEKLGGERLFFDGGNPEETNDGYVRNQDRFVANFKDLDAAIVWDMQKGYDAARDDDPKTDPFYRITAKGGSTEIFVGNIESVVLQTSEFGDAIVLHAGEDLLRTGGGNDYVSLLHDFQSDIVDLGEGDDQIEVGKRGYDTYPWIPDFFTDGHTRHDAVDKVDGGAGRDHAVQYNPSEDAGLDVEGLNAASRSDDLTRIRQGMDPGERVSYSFWEEISSGAKTGRLTARTDYSNVEHISVVGSASQNDVALFTGGLRYEGGASTGDTFVGDFTRYGGADGVVMRADGGRYTVGGSTITGFERLNVMGSAGDDALTGGAFEDVLEGGDGNDLLAGGAGADAIYGGEGDDIVRWANEGADTLDGDARDTSRKDRGGDDRLEISGNGGETAGLDWVLPGGAFNARSADAKIIDRIAAAADTHETVRVSFGRDPAMAFAGFEHVDVTGTEHDDLIVYLGGTRYDGGKGEGDTFAADFSASLVGIDFRLDGDGPLDLRNGVTVAGVERAVLRGTAGNDRLKGGALNDVFDGGAGSDQLVVSPGNDTLLGGTGADIVTWTDAAGGTSRAVLEGGAGVDTLIASAAHESLGIRVENGSETVIDTMGKSGETLWRLALDLGPRLATATGLEIGTGSHRARIDGFESATVAGSAERSDLMAMVAPGAYLAGEAADGSDVDIFVANLSSDPRPLIADLNAQGDELVDLNGTTVSGFEDFVLFLGAGDDRVKGSAELDHIDGGAGNDYLDTGGTNGLARTSHVDSLFGGAGDDTLVISGDEGHAFGGAGEHDKAVFGFAPKDETYPTPRTVLSLEIEGTSGKAAFSGLRPEWAGDVIDRVVGKEAPLLFGAIDSLHFYGPSTDVIIDGVEILEMNASGLVGPDYGAVLIGLDGGSSLTGGASSDTFVSRRGNDHMVGGKGYDFYIFDDLSGDDTISGEESGGGMIVLHGSRKLDLSALLLMPNDRIDGDVSEAGPTQDLLLTHAGGYIRIVNYINPNTPGGFDMDVRVEGETIKLSELPGLTPIPQPLTRGAVIGSDGAAAAEDDGPVHEVNVVYGTEEGDEIFGTGEHDILHGGGGDDYMVASGGGDVFDGGLGDNTVSYLTAEAEEGSVTRASLMAGRGFAGAAAGDSYLGIDNLVGNDGTVNELEGDGEDNILVGGTLGDRLSGEDGDDVLMGLDGDDTLAGGAGDDRVVGSIGADSLSGGSGDDEVVGGGGDDALDGGDGDDALWGNDGDDTATGGAGDDTYHYGGDDDPETGADDNGTDRFDGGAGEDTVDLNDYERGIAVEHRGAGVTVMTEGEDGELRTVLVAENVERLVATEQSDLVADAEGRVRYDLGGGDDFLGLLAGNRGGVYHGGDGFDAIGVEGGALDIDLTAADAALGTTGTLTDGAGAVSHIGGFEHFMGSDRADRFRGDDGANSFADGGGSDVFLGGGGDDVLLADVSKKAVKDRYDGGDGTDLIDYSADARGLALDLGKGTAKALGTSRKPGIGKDSVKGFEHAVTGSGDDVLTGGNGAETLDGGDGDDRVTGGRGSDRLIGGAGDDLLNGGTKKNDAGFFDIADYSGVEEGLKIAFGKKGIAVSTLGKGGWADTVRNVEAVAGGLGNDRIAGSKGGDHVLYSAPAGGGGFDRFNGKGGFDLLDFTEFGASIAVDLSVAPRKSAAQVVSNHTPSVLSGGAYTKLAQVKGVERIIGSDFDDLFLGGKGGDYLLTKRGDDVLVGRAGNDTLDGDLGYDTVDYSLEEGEARNTLPKGVVGKKAMAVEGVIVDLSGAVLDPDTGEAVAFDTYGDVDRLFGIENVVGTERGDFLIGSASGNVVLAGGGDDTVFGIAGDNGIDGGAGADSLIGGAGNETLAGGSGNDDLRGNDGDDLLDGGSGRDRMAGGQGDDTYQVDDAGDTVIEGAGEGTDTVLSFVSYTLGTHVEELELLGTGDIDGTGRADGDDRIVGNDGVNALDGLGGADTLEGGAGNDRLVDADGGDVLIGGAGDDLYIVAGPGAAIVEEEDGGTDMVSTSVDFVLPDWVETLVFTATAAADGTGNTRDNLLRGGGAANVLLGLSGDDTLLGGGGGDRLEGGYGDDRLSGDGGDDTLAGGHGADVFVMAGAFGTDTIEDFEIDIDRIDLTALRAVNGGAPLNADQILQTVSGADLVLELDLDFDGTADTVDLDGDGTGDAVSIRLPGAADTILIEEDFLF